jgi:hypothetical protein
MAVVTLFPIRLSDFHQANPFSATNTVKKNTVKNAARCIRPHYTDVETGLAPMCFYETRDSMNQR